MTNPESAICWRPDPGRRDSSAMAAFIRDRQGEGVNIPDPDHPYAFAALHAWSIAEPARFWNQLLRDGDVIADPWSGEAVVNGLVMAPPPLGGATWFPGLKLNFAENLLCGSNEEVALITWDERGPGDHWDLGRLRTEVSRVAAGLLDAGVGERDRVAGWLPNVAETVVAMLATTSIGATWTSASPDFGVDALVDRFGQVEPSVLFFADGHRYDGKLHDCTERASQLLDQLPTLKCMVMVSHLGNSNRPDDRRIIQWEDFGNAAKPLPPEVRRFPFDHPLFILYSSGTTGLPKCLVHGAGGVLLQHLKEHRLHADIRPGEPFFYFTTCGWMMWNWLVSGLASRAPLILYDGAPMPKSEPDILWRMAEAEGIAVFGTSARYLAMLEKQQIGPRSGDRGLARLRTVLSTGSPLAAASFDWLRRELPGVQPTSISGGTDIVSCLVLGNPLQPVRRGEIQGPGLGMDVDVLDPGGERCPPDTAGELCCMAPFPVMPISFWNDPGSERYRRAYFDRWDGVWCHGDWATRTGSGGFIISGRSDATLNPGGVRIGTAEIYRQVEAMDEIVESLVVGQRLPAGAAGDVRIVLFVRLRSGVVLDDELRALIRSRIRHGTSPHHVPRVIIAVPELPRTRSGKISELAVRDVIEGREVANVGALANPEALKDFRAHPELD